MNGRNQLVRDELAKHGLFLWQLGKIINVSESTITRMMREELPEDEQRKLVELIRKESEKHD